jgi:hypothetical protein
MPSAGGVTSAPLTAVQVRSTVFAFWIYEGRFPPGTTMATWRSLTMAQMHVDDPPLPSDPTLDARELARNLQVFFMSRMARLSDPTGILSGPTNTNQDLIDFCLANNAQMGTL